MSDVREFYQKVVHVTDMTALDYLEQHSDLLTYQRGEFLLEPDEQQKDLLVVLTGKLRGYLIDEEGRDITLRFAYRPGDLLLDGNGTLDTSTLYWETLSKVELVRIPVSVAHEAVRQYPELAVLADRVMWDLFREVSELQRALVTLKAKERWLWFRETYPDFPKGIPQKYVATYLNMLPQTLSQVRGALKKETQKKRAVVPVKVKVARKKK